MDTEIAEVKMSPHDVDQTICFFKPPFLGTPLPWLRRDSGTRDRRLETCSFGLGGAGRIVAARYTYARFPY